MGLRWPGVDDRDRTGVRVEVVASQEPCDLIERALGRRQPDALGRRVGERFESFEGQGEVRSSLGGRQRVDLVDDHRGDAPKGLAGRRREHEVERFGRRDEDVGRVRDECGADRERGCRPFARPPEGRGGAWCPLGRRRAGCPPTASAGSSRRRPRGHAAARCTGRGFARSGSGGGWALSRSIAHRNAASVLPDPVGARIRVWSPSAMAFQPWDCAGVGWSNEDSNHPRTAAENGGALTRTPYRLACDGRGRGPAAGVGFALDAPHRSAPLPRSAGACVRLHRVRWR